MNYEEILTQATRDYSKWRAELPAKESAFKELDSLTKTRLAESYLVSSGKTDNERKMMAFAHEMYKTHLYALAEAREQFNGAQAQVDIHKARYEAAKALLIKAGIL